MAFYRRTADPIGCEAVSARVLDRATLHITATRPIVGCTIFRPWAVCRCCCTAAFLPLPR